MNHLFRRALVAAAIGLTFSACDQNVATPDDSADVRVSSENGAIIPGRFIVVLEPAAVAGKTVRQVIDAVANDAAAVPDQRYEHSIYGFAAAMSDEAASRLADDPRVRYVEPDRVITLDPISIQGGGDVGIEKGRPGGGGGDGTTPVQTVPWGIVRVNGGVACGNCGTAWIIDSGIDLDHTDLNVDIARSRSFLGGRDADNPDDANGHGTHVAGTVAAVDNNQGVIGVAAGATVVSVRVLDRRGSGSYSGVIGGVDYVGASGAAGDVANMSLGGGYSQALNDAVVAASSNVKFALAAGNESADASTKSPASAEGPNIYTISAFAEGDSWASFSNYGSPVEFSAPGVYVESTWKDGGYNTISGTSMATPHVAGILLLGPIRSDGTVSGDPDGSPDPIAVH